MRTMIYIASPYSHENKLIESWRYEQAFAYARKLTAKGEVAFSPITYGHQFALRDFPGDASYWYSFNRQMLLASHSIHLLQLPGWEESSGIAMELDFAKNNMMPVVKIPFTGQ